MQLLTLLLSIGTALALSAWAVLIPTFPKEDEPDYVGTPIPSGSYDTDTTGHLSLPIHGVFLETPSQ